MATDGQRPISGHVFRREGARGAVWYAKYRLPDGRQKQQRIGPAWTRRGRPAAGYFTKHSAEAHLAAALDQARRGTLPGMVRTGATFADASAEWLRYVEHERAIKQSTLSDYADMVRRLDDRFGASRLEDITTSDIELWKAGMTGLANSTLRKYLVVLHGIFKRSMKVYGLPRNPVAEVERPRLKRRAGIDVLTREEVWALVRAAASEQDAAIYLTAALTGLRQGELLALRWGDVDFERQTIRVSRNYTHGKEDTPKSGRSRVVPLAQDVQAALARLGQREHWTGDQDLVFVGRGGGHVQAGRLVGRYKRALTAAGLRELRFHDLRHVFGSHAIRHADPREVQEWMGHSDISVTGIYLQFKERSDAARRITEAFAADPDAAAV